MGLKSREHQMAVRQLHVPSRPQQVQPRNIDTWLLGLQRSAGNRAVARVLAEPVTPRISREDLVPVQRGRWQFGDVWVEADTYAEARDLNSRGLTAAPAVPGGAPPPPAEPALPPVDTSLDNIMTPDPAYPKADGHAPDKLGLGETFQIDAKQPDGVAIGNARWSVVGGATSGTADAPAGTITAVATSKDGVTLKLVGSTGTFAGKVLLAELRVPVVEPTRTVAAMQGVFPKPGAGTVGAGMELKFWFEPSDVCFTNIEWREPGGENALLVGNMRKTRDWGLRNNMPQLTYHGGNPDTPRSVAAEEGGRRNWIQQYDRAQSIFGKECAPGTFIWNISWEYRVKNPKSSWVKFRDKTVEHKLEVTGAQPGPFDATISKEGLSHTETGFV